MVTFRGSGFHQKSWKKAARADLRRSLGQGEATRIPEKGNLIEEAIDRKNGFWD
jgi:hypothetical protein